MTTPGTPLRLLSWRLAGRAAAPEVAAALRAADVDVACLQRAPAGWRATARCAALARAAGLYIAAGGELGGTLVLVSMRVRVVGHRAIVLGRGRRPAAAAVAEIGLGGDRWTLVSLALSGPPVERRRQADELIYQLGGPSGSLVVAGAPGAGPDGARRTLTAALQDAARAGAGPAPAAADAPGRSAGSPAAPDAEQALYLGAGVRAIAVTVPPVVAAGAPPPLLATVVPTSLDRR